MPYVGSKPHAFVFTDVRWNGRANAAHVRDRAARCDLRIRIQAGLRQTDVGRRGQPQPSSTALNAGVPIRTVCIRSAIRLPVAAEIGAMTAATVGRIIPTFLRCAVWSTRAIPTLRFGASAFRLRCPAACRQADVGRGRAHSATCPLGARLRPGAIAILRARHSVHAGAARSAVVPTALKRRYRAEWFNARLCASRLPERWSHAKAANQLPLTVLVARALASSVAWTSGTAVARPSRVARGRGRLARTRIGAKLVVFAILRTGTSSGVATWHAIGRATRIAARTERATRIPRGAELRGRHWPQMDRRIRLRDHRVRKECTHVANVGVRGQVQGGVRGDQDAAESSLNGDSGGARHTKHEIHVRGVRLDDGAAESKGSPDVDEDWTRRVVDVQHRLWLEAQGIEVVRAASDFEVRPGLDRHIPIAAGVNDFGVVRLDAAAAAVGVWKRDRPINALERLKASVLQRAAVYDGSGLRAQVSRGRERAVHVRVVAQIDAQGLRVNVLHLGSHAEIRAIGGLNARDRAKTRAIFHDRNRVSEREGAACGAHPNVFTPHALRQLDRERYIRAASGGLRAKRAWTCGPTARSAARARAAASPCRASCTASPCRASSATGSRRATRAGRAAAGSPAACHSRRSRRRRIPRPRTLRLGRLLLLHLRP